MIFCDRVKMLLKEKGVSQKDFLEKLNLGRNSFTHWSKYGNLPRHETLVRIAAYLGVSKEYLTGESNERKYDESAAAISVSADDTISTKGLPQVAIEELKDYIEILRIKHKEK